MNEGDGVVQDADGRGYFIKNQRVVERNKVEMRIINGAEHNSRLVAAAERLTDMIDFYNDLEHPKIKIKLGVKLNTEAAYEVLRHFESHCGCYECGTEKTYGVWIKDIIHAAMPDLLI